MKRINKVISTVILALLLFSVVSCGLRYIPNDEEAAFERILPELFEALDGGDSAAVYELFSHTVREQSDDLEEQIAALISIYGGPTDAFELESVGMVGEEHIGAPGNWATAEATIPVRSGDSYYFFSIVLTFEHYDEKEVGITQLEFYTDDELCAFLESDDHQIRREGLYLHAEKELGCEIRTICGKPIRYVSATETINIEEVKEFIKSSASISEFTGRFGEPNAKSPDVVSVYYYELPKEKGAPRYLRIVEHEGEVISITVADDFRFVEVVWKKED